MNNKYLACTYHPHYTEHCQFCYYASADGTGFDVKREIKEIKSQLADLQRLVLETNNKKRGGKR
jgi:hypothetical protein